MEKMLMTAKYGNQEKLKTQRGGFLSHSDQGGPQSLSTRRAQRWLTPSLVASPSGSLRMWERAETQRLPEALHLAEKSARGLLWRDEQWFDADLSGVGTM